MSATDPADTKSLVRLADKTFYAAHLLVTGGVLDYAFTRATGRGSPIPLPFFAMAAAVVALLGLVVGVRAWRVRRALDAAARAPRPPVTATRRRHRRDAAPAVATHNSRRCCPKPSVVAGVAVNVAAAALLAHTARLWTDAANWRSWREL